MSLQKWTDRIWVLKLAPEPSFTEEMDSLAQQVTRHVSQDAPVPHIVLDLSALREMNSSNLSAILRVRKMTIDGDAKLRIAAPHDTVWAVFLMTGLDKIFEFSPDVSTALAGLKMSPDEA